MSPKIRRLKQTISMLGLVSAFLFLSSCTQSSPQATTQTPQTPQATDQTSQKPVIKVSRCNLFPGDLKRLEPYLDLGTTICFKFDYTKATFDGDSVEWVIQEWRNGKPSKQDISPNVRKSGLSELPGPWPIYEKGGELSLAVKRTGVPNNPATSIRVVVQEEQGSVNLGSHIIDGPQYYSNDPKNIFESSVYHDGVLELEPNKPIPIWGLAVEVAKDFGSVPEDVIATNKEKDISKAAQRADWALVLNLRRVKKDNKAQK